MRLKAIRGPRGIALWTWVALALCALAPEAVASGLIRSTPSLWTTATALGPDADNGGKCQPEIGHDGAGGCRAVPASALCVFCFSISLPSPP
jgi:hypothetical protein